MPCGSLLKNDHLRRFSCPLAGPSSLRRTAEYASGRLTNSPAWQEVAPYSSRRHSQDFRAPANGISQNSTCICLPARSRFGEGRVLFEQPAKDLFQQPATSL